MAGILVLQLTTNNRRSINILYLICTVLLIIGCALRKGWASATFHYNFVDNDDQSYETNFNTDTHGCQNYTATNEVYFGLTWRQQTLTSTCPYLQSSDFTQTLDLSYQTWNYFNPSQYHVVVATQILYVLGFICTLISYALYQHAMLIDDKRGTAQYLKRATYFCLLSAFLILSSVFVFLGVSKESLMMICVPLSEPSKGVVIPTGGVYNYKCGSAEDICPDNLPCTYEKSTINTEDWLWGLVLFVGLLMFIVFLLMRRVWVVAAQDYSSNHYLSKKSEAAFGSQASFNGSKIKSHVFKASTRDKILKRKWVIMFLSTVIAVFYIVATTQKGGWWEGTVSTQNSPYFVYSSPDSTISHITVNKTINTDYTIRNGLWGIYIEQDLNVVQEQEEIFYKNHTNEVLPVENYTTNFFFLTEEPMSVWESMNSKTAKNDVIATKVLLFIALAGHLLAWGIFFYGLNHTEDKQRAIKRMNLASYLEIFSAFFLFISILIWLAVPESARTNVCGLEQYDVKSNSYNCIQYTNPCQYVVSGFHCKILKPFQVEQIQSMWILMLITVVFMLGNAHTMRSIGNIVNILEVLSYSSFNGSDFSSNVEQGISTNDDIATGYVAMPSTNIKAQMVSI